MLVTDKYTHMNTHVHADCWQWLVQMVGEQADFADNVRELMGGGGGALSWGERVKSFRLESTAAHTHTHTHLYTHTHACIASQLSMWGLHRSFWKCSETWQSCVTQQWEFASSCLSVCLLFKKNVPLSHFYFLLSLPLCPHFVISPLLLRLCSARTHPQHHTLIFYRLPLILCLSLSRSS